MNLHAKFRSSAVTEKDSPVYTYIGIYIDPLSYLDFVCLCNPMQGGKRLQLGKLIMRTDCLHYSSN